MQNAPVSGYSNILQLINGQTHHGVECLATPNSKATATD